MDALLVVHFLTRPFGDNHSLGTSISDCLELINERWVLEMRHELREGNKCMDRLANLAQDLALGVVLPHTPPISILSLLQVDACVKR
ncbi:hypothetical protein Goari_022181, partial [Gossypium aridum]|nr:hypothetical protein [Gossypium aridum]